MPCDPGGEKASAASGSAVGSIGFEPSAILRETAQPPQARARAASLTLGRPPARPQGPSVFAAAAQHLPDHDHVLSILRSPGSFLRAQDVLE